MSGVNQLMEPAALEALVRSHAAALTLYARQLTDRPDDVVQEAFVKLASFLGGPVEAVPWLYRVVRNGAISAARAERRRRKYETMAGRVAWFAPAADGELDADEVTALLQQLPAESREAITLHLWSGLTFAEIAGVLDCSASSAHRWYQSGLEVLRERLLQCRRK